jgi:hypothetical protein
VAIGVWWLGESAATGAGVLAGEVAAAAVITLGIAVLARRADHLAVHRQSESVTRREPPTGTPPNSAEQAAGWALDR